MSELIIINGLRGVGKTALATAFAVELMTEKAKENVLNSKRLIKVLNSGGFNFTTNFKHLVFSDYRITVKKEWMPRRISHDINAFDFGLPNDQHPTNLYPPFSTFVFDEGQAIFNSRMSSFIPDFCCRGIEVSRHNEYGFIIVSQRFKLIDLNIRNIADIVIDVQKMDIKYDLSGNIKKIKWHCKQFNSGSEAEIYSDSNNTKGGKDVVFTYNGNIFECYNNKDKRALFYKDKENSDFDIRQSKGVKLSVDGVKEFNKNHSFEIPVTWYKKKGR